jgi:GTP-binding protein
MAFVDEIQLEISAGKGGDGVVRWRREKFKPMSGPGGGNGGRGGDVYAEAVHDLAYLNFYRHKKKFQASHGEAGRKDGEEGANGQPLILNFPVGTVITNKETKNAISLDKIGQRELLLKGGRGGYGNEHFKSSTNTTPYESTPGKMGISGVFEIELELIADVGFIGLPSAGKSTLLNSLTNAQSKVAAYHFTTLEPHLGVLKGGTVLADIPGLIKGASEGKGLGHKFLRHIKRTKILAHVISLESGDVVVDYQQIRAELEKYDTTLTEKKEVIVLSKADLLDRSALETQRSKLESFVGDKQIFVTSTEDSNSLKSLADGLNKLVVRSG